MVLVSKHLSLGQQMELTAERAGGDKPIIPVLAPGTSLGSVSPLLKQFVVTSLKQKTLQSDLARLADGVQKVLGTSTREASTQIDPEDPQKGQWGGLAERNGRLLTATVEALSQDWFGITLEIRRLTGPPLEGTVEFHLHPTFTRHIEQVTVKDGKATLPLSAWGAFTVGALADKGRTRLELDLSQNPSFPQTFRER